MALQGVIFDVDGTLVDSNDAHAQSWVDTFAEAGYEVPFEVVRPLIGMGADKLLPKTIGIRHDSEQGKKLIKRRSEIFRERYLPNLRPLPGARGLVLRVRDDGLKAIVATSAKDDELKGLLKAAEVDDLMEEKATASDAKRSKPDPDIVEAAIEESGLPSSNAVMIGDTPYDVEAATQAGVRVIAFRSGGWDDASLKGAAQIYDGPADLLAHYDASLLGRRDR
ncbi:MAG: HAD-superfamily hydrolase, subfamily variant 1 [Gemmatimonadales bacterium]|nr:HAD-superfamily hydrolase, subfamily variant 1 [Gemmatimonadales bacterium]